MGRKSPFHTDNRIKILHMVKMTDASDCTLVTWWVVVVFRYYSCQGFPQDSQTFKGCKSYFISSKLMIKSFWNIYKYNVHTYQIFGMLNIDQLQTRSRDKRLNKLLEKLMRWVWATSSMATFGMSSFAARVSSS